MSSLSEARSVGEFAENAIRKSRAGRPLNDCERIIRKLHMARVNNWQPQFDGQPAGSVMSSVLGTQICLDYRRRIHEIRKQFGPECIEGGLVTYTGSNGRKKKLGWYKLNLSPFAL